MITPFNLKHSLLAQHKELTTLETQLNSHEYDGHVSQEMFDNLYKTKNDLCKTIEALDKVPLLFMFLASVELNKRAGATIKVLKRAIANQKSTSSGDTI